MPRPGKTSEFERLKFVTDALFGDHIRGIAHPERPERVEAVQDRLTASGVLKDCVAARDAADEELERVHPSNYIELVARETEAATGGTYLSTGDTVIDQTSYQVARRAAGGAVVAAQTAARDGEPVFALVRPPGHHAEPSRGMGFCLFNNVAVAARAYQAAHGGTSCPVLVVDFDYHHGNGTEAVAGDGLSYVSSHAFPAYPGTGTRTYRLGDDIVANVPLPPGGISTEAFVRVWEEVLPIVAALVRPKLVLVSAGFDYVAGDPVGDLGVGVEAAAPVAAAIRRIGQEHSGGAIAYFLEGGYDLTALSGSIAAIAEVHDQRESPDPVADAASLPVQVRRSVALIAQLVQGSA